MPNDPPRVDEPDTRSQSICTESREETRQRKYCRFDIDDVPLRKIGENQCGMQDYELGM